MKTKLLKKARKLVKLYSRNGKYYVNTRCYIYGPVTHEEALQYYRRWILIYAEEIFGFKPKKQLL